MAKRKPQRDRLRRPGEHWYELVSYFDAEEIEALPMKEGRAFLMGTLENLIVIEVSVDIPADTIQKLHGWLSENGVKGLIVTDSIKFLKIKPCSREQEKQLDAAQVKDGEKA